MIRALLALPCVHTLAIFGLKYSHLRSYDQQIESESLIGPPAEYRVGGIFDRISDSLKSGDIVLIERKWYRQYFWVAMDDALRRHWRGSSSDQLGVIVTDQFGQAYVIEAGFMSRPKMTPFIKWLRMSDDERIELLQLIPRDRKWNGEAVIEEFKAFPSDSSSVTSLSTFERRYVDAMLHFEKTKKPQMRSVPTCRSTVCAKAVYSCLGVSLQFPVAEDEAAIQHFEQGLVEFSEDASQAKFSTSPDRIVLRAR